MYLFPKHCNLKTFQAFLFVLTISMSCTLADEEVQKIPKCPGLYCGRTLNDTGGYSSCGACPRGYRPDEVSICQRCEGEPTFYDWLYLGFMAMLPPALHWFFIDFTNKRKPRSLSILYVSALLESIVAAVCTLLVMEPYGKFQVRSCEVKDLADWYTMMYNPRPGYTTTLHCTQEIVYPLYTMVMVYYAFGLVMMMMFRPGLSARFVSFQGTKSIYAALYFFPILVVLQAIFGGVLYYFFPYIIIVVSVITIAGHFALYQEQSMKYIVVETFKRPRNLMILLSHWMLHAYGIISITQMQKPTFHGPLICLVPFPAIFYVLTVKFTDPKHRDFT